MLMPEQLATRHVGGQDPKRHLDAHERLFHSFNPRLSASSMCIQAMLPDGSGMKLELVTPRTYSYIQRTKQVHSY